MADILRILASLAEPDGDGVVPPRGFSAQLTLLTSAAMAFLAVFALALSLASDRLAERWASELARTATVRISAPQGQLDGQTAAALAVLATTPGVRTAEVISEQEEQDLLTPWFGPDLPIDSLPLPRLISVVETGDGIDVNNLRLRLAAEAPGAVFDDHTSWRKPLIAAADRLSMLAVVSLAVIGFAMAAMITLAANSALAANEQVITVLRLVGARDQFIRRAFVRRFTRRGFVGGAIGVVLGVVGVLLLPGDTGSVGFLSGLGFQGLEWALVLLVPLAAALVAYLATRYAAGRVLGGVE